MAGRGNISPGSLLLPLAILILALFFFRAFYAGSGEEQSADQAPVLESRIERVEPPPAAGLQPEKMPVARVGEEAPSFSVQGANGKIDLADYSGQPLVIEFIATWCQHCRASAPAFAEVFRDSQVPLLVVGAAREPLGTVRDWHENFLPQPMPGKYAVDPDQEAVRAYGVTGTPTTVFIDSAGRIRELTVGELDAGQIRSGLALID